MEAEIFDKIMLNLEDTRARCLKVKETAKTTGVGDGLITEAKQLQSKMDKIMQNELYHIIGMGHLSFDQTNRFITAVKRLGMYRADVKLIASLTPELKGRELSVGTSRFKSELAGTILVK